MKHSCCIILAAGLSSRMGSFKPLLPIGGQPAIRFLTNTLFQAGVEQCIIVTGHNRHLIREACKDIPNICWGYNPDYASTGMFESSKIGFELLPEDCGRVLLMPADIPLVSEGTIRTLLNMNEPLVFPSYHYRKGHPVSFSPDILPALLAYRGEQGLRGAFSNAQIEPAYLNTDDPFILMDMDTPEDYQNILHRKSEAL